MLEIVDQLPEENNPGENAQKDLPASSDPASDSLEPAVVDSANLLPPKVLVQSAERQQQRGDDGDVASVSEVPEVRTRLSLLFFGSVSCFPAG